MRLLGQFCVDLAGSHLIRFFFLFFPPPKTRIRCPSQDLMTLSKVYALAEATMPRLSVRIVQLFQFIYLGRLSVNIARVITHFMLAKHFGAHSVKSSSTPTLPPIPHSCMKLDQNVRRGTKISAVEVKSKRCRRKFSRTQDEGIMK